MHGHKALCEIIAHKYKYDSYRVIKEILQSLVKEKISIRNTIQIFETIADEEMISRNGPLNLYEKVRLSIAPDNDSRRISGRKRFAQETDKPFLFKGS